jgi:hypothetical protein
MYNNEVVDSCSCSTKLTSSGSPRNDLQKFDSPSINNLQQ